MSTARVLLWLALALALAAAVMLYLQPGFMVLLAEQVWACF
ncbi:hypothetical protein [Comamonas badia]|nr:hypothetical protein [Comamonas badia]